MRNASHFVKLAILAQKIRNSH